MPNKVPEDMAFAFVATAAVAAYLADEVVRGSTEYLGDDPDPLVTGLTHVFACQLLEKPREELLSLLRESLAKLELELLEDTTDAE